MASGRLTTHVLDTANGVPARGLKLDLSQISANGPILLKTETTNDDGRCDAPLLAGDDFRPGWYELSFDVGAYFANRGQAPDGAFLGVVPVRFQIIDTTAHYHVPLLVSPFGYSTYRGS